MSKKKLTVSRKRSDILREECNKLYPLYGLKVPKISRDNRFNGHLITEFWEEGDITLKYNARRLGKWSYAMIVCGVLHEIGHQVIDPHGEKPNDVEDEYKAELFAVKEMRKFYPELLQEVSRIMKIRLKKAWWKRRYPMHLKAFLKIKEYRS